VDTYAKDAREHPVSGAILAHPIPKSQYIYTGIHNKYTPAEERKGMATASNCSGAKKPLHIQPGNHPPGKSTLKHCARAGPPHVARESWRAVPLLIQ